MATRVNGTAVEAVQQLERLGRYRILARLGQGGMGTIYLAVAGGLADFRKLLVVKELRCELTSNERFVEMFLAEAKLAARLDHPNIVQTLEAGQDGERYFLAMEFLDGQPLVEILKRVDVCAPGTTSLLIQILCEVLAGLHYAHELCDYDETPLRIVHRDVNPHNVFVTYHGHVKLVDFGIAKAIDSEMCTTAGVFKGKFPYAAPEQVNCQTVDRRADVFAVGVMLWEILARRRFAPGQPTTDAIDTRLAGKEPRIAAVRPDIDPELAAICDHAMQVNPALRYPTADEFRTDLLDFLAARTEMATNVTLRDMMRRDFAQERAAAHRVISTQVRKLMPDEELGDSLVRVLTRTVTSPGLAPNSLSASLSAGASATARLHDASKLDTSPARLSLRRSEAVSIALSSEHKNSTQRTGVRRARVLAVSVIAVCAFVGAYFLVRANFDQKRAVLSDAPRARTGIVTGIVRPAPLHENSVSAATASAPASLQTASALEPSSDGPSPAVSLAQQKTAKQSTAKKSTDALQRAAVRAAPRSHATHRPSLQRESRRAKHAAVGRAAAASAPPALAPAARIPASERVGGSLSANPVATKAATNPPSERASARPLRAGDDLRVLRGQRKPRPLSLEDPFR